MAAKRTRQKLGMSDKEIEKLEQLSVSRTEPYNRVTRARVPESSRKAVSMVVRSCYCL